MLSSNNNLFFKIKKYIIVINLICIMVFNTYGAIDEYIGGGFILYGDITVTKGNDITKYSDDFFNLLKKLKSSYSECSVSFVPAIQSQILIEDIKKLNNKLDNQKLIVEKFKQLAGNNINVVNSYDILNEHKNEYIYYKYDNHWTSRGAYYAYVSYCKSMNYNYPPISSFNEILLNENYIGLAYYYTNDVRIVNKTDKLYAYIPTYSNVLKVYNSKNDIIKQTQCIDTKDKSYNAFLSGDHPFSEINVLNTNNKKNALVLKDSFGSTFIPYLVYNYKNIYIIDPRRASYKLNKKIKNLNIDDIIVVTAINKPASKDFINNLTSLLE